MHQPDQLYLLIHSLNKAEKRYFKRYAQRNARAAHSNYILLFDALARQRSYDEAKLKKSLKQYSFVKTLPQTKLLLQQLIYKTLRDLHDSRGTRAKIHALIESAELLSNKALHTQSFNAIQKAKNLAAAHELFSLQLRLLQMEYHLLPYLQIEHELSEEALFNQRNVVTVQLQVEATFERYLTIVRAVANNNSSIAPPLQLEAVMEDPFLHNDSHARSFRAKLMYNEIHARYALLKGRMHTAFQFHERIRMLWRGQPEMAVLYRELYLQHAFDYVQCGINVPTVRIEFDTLVDELLHLKPLTSQDAERSFFLTTLLSFIFHVAQKKMELCKVELFTIQHLLENHQNKLQFEWRVSLYYHICIYHFLNGEYADSLEWFEKLELLNTGTAFPNVFNYCKLVGLIAKYELGEHDELDVEVRKVYRYLHKSKQIGVVERLVLKSVRNLLYACHRKERLKIYTHLHYSLKKLERINAPMQQTTSNAILHWLQPKLPSQELKTYI